MCFTPEMSWGFSISMFLFAALWPQLPRNSRIAITYFGLMELLQAFQHMYVNQCDLMINKVLTVLGLAHIAFQPFFVNLYISDFMNYKQRAYTPFILVMSLFAGVLMVNRMWVTEGDKLCEVGFELMCGTRSCTFTGQKHLAWQVPMQHSASDQMTYGFNLHFFMFFLPAFALGAYAWFFGLLLSGPILARAITDQGDEIPSIWCFFSILQVGAPLVIAALGHPNGLYEFFQSKKEGAASKKDKTAPVVQDPFASWTVVIGRVFGLFVLLTLKRFALMHFGQAK